MATDADRGTKPRVSVCVCTYRRPQWLQRLLQCLERQVTAGLFDYDIVVADNDEDESARHIVESFAATSAVPITYGCEPRQNISLARNCAVRMATAPLVAFVDDDEEPAEDWLLKLYLVLVERRVDGVVGPVLPLFENDAPMWAVKGRFFYRPGFATGQVIHWTAGATGSTLLKREVLSEVEGPFRPEFGAGGEDKDFFRRSMSRNRVFAWCADAMCYERVPPERTRVGFQLRRALLRGKMARRGPGGSWRGILKSAVAVPAYFAVLPVCLPLGSHVSVSCLVRSFDHLGKLLAACGIDVVGDKYITSNTSGI